MSGLVHILEWAETKQPAKVVAHNFQPIPTKKMPKMKYYSFQYTLEELNLCRMALQEGVHRRSDFGETERKSLGELIECYRDIVEEFSNEVFS